MMNIKTVEHLFHRLMVEGLGLDLNDPNLIGTPARVAKMYCKEFFVNVGEEFTDFALSQNHYEYDQIIALERIHFTAICAHHFLPFTGLCWVLYVPNTHLVGASKPARLVNHYASRPQLQENLCHEVAHAFWDYVEPHGVMVVMKGIHDCMKCRGVKQYAGAGMATSVVLGSFMDDPSLKAEGLSLIQLPV